MAVKIVDSHIQYACHDDLKILSLCDTGNSWERVEIHIMPMQKSCKFPQLTRHRKIHKGNFHA